MTGHSIRYHALWTWAILALILASAAAIALAFWLLYHDQTGASLGVWALAVILLGWTDMTRRRKVKEFLAEYGDGTR